MINAFHLKEVLPKHVNSKVLYKLKFDICNSFYIGKTKRHLLVDQNQHSTLSILKEKALKYTEKDATTIRKRCHQNEHLCSVDNFAIVGIAANDFPFKLKEYLVISEMMPCLNISEKLMLLHLFDNDSRNVIGK